MHLQVIRVVDTTEGSRGQLWRVSEKPSRGAKLCIQWKSHRQGSHCDDTSRRYNGAIRDCSFTRRTAFCFYAMSE